MKQLTRFLKFIGVVFLLLVCNINRAKAQAVAPPAVVFPCYGIKKSDLNDFLTIKNPRTEKNRSKVVICPSYNINNLTTPEALELYILNKADTDGESSVQFDAIPKTVPKASSPVCDNHIASSFVVSNCEIRLKALREAINDPANNIDKGALIYFRPTLDSNLGETSDGLKHMHYAIGYIIIQDGKPQFKTLEITGLEKLMTPPNPSPPSKPGEY